MPGNVDGFVDVNTFITASHTSDSTHYNEAGQELVGQAVGSFLSSLIGAIAGAVAIKDRNVAAAQVIRDGAPPVAPQTGETP